MSEVIDILILLAVVTTCCFIGVYVIHTVGYWIIDIPERKRRKVFDKNVEEYWKDYWRFK